MSAYVRHVYDKNTEAFIAENPVLVRIERRMKQTVAGGGWKWIHDKWLDPQEARLVRSGNVSDVSAAVRATGRINKEDAKLVFTLDGDVQAGDIAHIGEEQWEVFHVAERYSKTAEVTRNAG